MIGIRLSISVSFVIVFLACVFSKLSCVEGKPLLRTKDKGVSLPILPSTLNNSWCRSAFFKERITEPGCESKLVYNRFCYGQCTSFYVPRFPFDSVRMCNGCLPVVTERRLVQLKCPGKKNKVHLKEILLVKNCRCRADFTPKSKTKGRN